MTLNSDDLIGIAAAALADHRLTLTRQAPTTGTVPLGESEHVTLTFTPGDPHTGTRPGWEAVYHDTTDPTRPLQATLYRTENDPCGHTASDPATDARTVAAEVAAAVLPTRGAPRALSSAARAAAHTRAGAYRAPGPDDTAPVHTTCITGAEVAVHLDADTETLTVAVDTGESTGLLTDRGTVALRLLVNGHEVVHLP